MNEYNEIFRLKEMLEQSGIPFEFKDRSVDQYLFYQIGYPSLDEKSLTCSVVEGLGTYGAQGDLLEMAWYLKDEEYEEENEEYDDVVGGCTAEDVFTMIKKNHDYIQKK